jgi:hypothetical protein
MAILIAEKYGVGIEYVEYPEVAEKIETGDTVFDDNKLKERLKLNYEMPFLKWCMEG